MSQRDGSGKYQFSSDSDDEFGPDEPTADPAPRRSSPTYEEELDLPAWGAQRSRPSSRDAGQQSSSSKSARRNHREAPAGGSTREPIPTLGDAFERPASKKPPEKSRGSSAGNETAERQPRTTSSPVRSSTGRQVSTYSDPYGDPYTPDDYEDEYVEYRDTRTRRRSAPDTRTASRRPSGTQQIGGLIATAGPQTRILGAVGGFAIVSLILMAATLLARVDSLADWIPIHLNAEGEPDVWGTASTLWRIPLMTLVLTLMSAAVAWYLWKRDQFAARFTLGSTMLINVLSWIALINFVW